MANMTEYLRDALAQHALRNVAYTSPTTVYLALYETTPPDATGAGTEVTGGSYARTSITFSTTATDGLLENDLASIADMPATSVVGLAILDASTAGNMLFFEDFSGSPVSVQVGDTYVVPASSISVTFS